MSSKRVIAIGIGILVLILIVASLRGCREDVQQRGTEVQIERPASQVFASHVVRTWAAR